MDDKPHINNQDDKTRFGGVGDRRIRGERAIVREYYTDTYTCDLHTERGRPLRGVQQIRSAPGAVAPLEPGCEVLITYEFGQPYILGCIVSPAREDTSAPFSVTGVSGFGGQGNNRSVNPELGSFRKVNEPTDIMPGDFVQVGAEGNMIGVLSGGANVVKSSPLAQVRTHALNDLVEILCRNYRHVTDMGIMEVINDAGRINMSFRGGTDQSTETGIDEEKWGIRFDLGSEGDIFKFELTTPLGQTLFRIHVDAEGQCEIYGINGVSINSGSQAGGVKSEESTGDRRATIGGNNTEEIAGDVASAVGGSETHTVDSSYTLSSGNDINLSALRDVGLGVGRNMAVQVMGPLIPGDALTFNVATGNFVVDVGEVVSPFGNFQATTYEGDFDFKALLGGDFKVETLLGDIDTLSLGVKLKTQVPDSVVLGGRTGVLLSHVAKFEQLATYINALHNALDNHIHDITTAPAPAVAGPFKVVGTTGLPLLPISLPLTGLVPPIKSEYVGVGG